MHQDILREMRAEILNVKKDSMSWQTEAARSQEVSGLSLQIEIVLMNWVVLDQGSRAFRQNAV